MPSLEVTLDAESGGFHVKIGNATLTQMLAMVEVARIQVSQKFLKTYDEKSEEEVPHA
jgi:hypothetical protein